MELNEVWRDIPGYKGLYQVSNFGNVKSLDYKRSGKEHLLSVHDAGKGYLVVSIKNKMHKVHRLVYQAFIGNIPEGYEVNHLDENRSNNSLDNLSLLTHKENCNYGTRNIKLSKPVICMETSVLYQSSVEAEKLTGIQGTHIRRCCKSKGRYTAGGYHWIYELDEPFIDKELLYAKQSNKTEHETEIKKGRKKHKQHKQQTRSEWHQLVIEGKTYEEINIIYPNVNRANYRKVKSRINNKKNTI